jgi:hypothetical protein
MSTPSTDLCVIFSATSDLLAVFFEITVFQNRLARGAFRQTFVGRSESLISDSIPYCVFDSSERQKVPARDSRQRLQ